MKSRAFPSLAISLGVILVAFTTFAYAGTPLVCHPIEIGQAKTLRWVDLNYQKGSGDYDLKNLVHDTMAILESDSSVLVHMETLRRATLYARQDQQAKASARSVSLGIQALNAPPHEWHRKHESKNDVYRQGVNHRFGEDLKHLYRRPGSQIR